MAWFVGGMWNIQATVVNPITGSPTEPETITFTIKRPNGHESSAEAVKIGLGVYEANVELVEQGSWKASVQTTKPKGSQAACIPVAPRYGLRVG